MNYHVDLRGRKIATMTMKAYSLIQGCHSAHERQLEMLANHAKFNSLSAIAVS